VKKLLILLSTLIFIFVLGILYAMFLRTDLTITKAEAKERFSTEHSHFVQWNNAEIHYTDAGVGESILMIHGFGGNFTNFDSLSDILKESHRVVRVDLPGFGMSDLPAKHDSIALLYREFLGFMLDTLHIDSVTVIGNSLGGWMGWELAASYPEKVKGLVLLGSAGYEIEKVKSNIGRMDLLDNAFARKLAERGLPVSLSMQNAKRMMTEWETPNPASVAVNNALLNREGNLANMITLANSGITPDTAKIATIQCPTLVIWGKYDIIVPVEHSAKFTRDIPNSVSIVYDTCGHIPQIEYPHRVANDIKTFLSAQ
jgi:pimeloyl-ACP methyl ester carboxylesterase